MLKFLSHVVIVCVSDTVNGKYYEGCSKSYPPEYDITQLNKLIFYNNKFIEYDVLSSVHCTILLGVMITSQCYSIIRNRSCDLEAVAK